VVSRKNALERERHIPGPILTSKMRPPTMDSVWKKSYLQIAIISISCPSWNIRETYLRKSL
jgi:hypothetical protein